MYLNNNNNNVSSFSISLTSTTILVMTTSLLVLFGVTLAMKPVTHRPFRDSLHTEQSNHSDWSIV